MPARETRPTTTHSIAVADRDRVHHDLLGLGGVDEPPGPYEAWRIKLSDGGSQARAILYQSGKLVVSGHAPAFDQVIAVAETVGKKMPAKPKTSGTTAVADVPAETEPHIGTDEAGKGDFFGPMVTAGVYVDSRTAQIMRTLGVRDSKTVSDRELPGLAANIREVIPDGSRAVLVLAPKRYNELYRQMRSEGKNLNTMLAWTHTRVIEDLIKAGLKPHFILSDQFGDKRYIESRLLMDTRLSGIPVIQMHRAEADVGVAAASILARDRFLRWMDQASKTLGVTVPKGASPNVIEVARSLVRRSGQDILKEYAKVSFKTMQKVLAP
ncbi:MAG TPA: ribonuclease HIII [Candidatus Angelobacter sp.]|nr:ribonuclease HIII [Candidatus Angelobacter sp.]